ncbi:MAG: PKD domain-containing protein [Candidatus Bipolaricaulota bacterium]|nr:PKD domain-containing protein [Candidatus Bipolaricaulota bacterium]MBS3792848.1 PKD domain-containing protein [Candidatus Bipolaricaulota bacterium]
MKRSVKYLVLAILFSVLMLSLNGCNSNEEPTASFSANPTTGGAPLQVTFDASNSEDQDGIIDSFDWEFGDGTSTGGRVVEHSFSSPGEYTVELTVTDNDGATDSTTQTVTVEESGPSAALEAEPREGEAPLTVSFDLSKSEDPDGVIEEYSLKFGDGQSTSGTDILDVVEHEYASAGEYSPTLELTDDDGLSSSTSITITVNEPPPENELPSASITLDSDTGTAPVTLEFSAEDSSDPDGNIESYVWEFGDGTTSRGSEVSHRYDQAGSYTVKLTVTDNRDGKATAERTVEINPATYYVGESASNDAVRITLQDASFAETINDWEAGAGRQFVILEINVRALEGEQYPSKSLNFTLEESDGREQTVSLATSALDEYFKSNILEEGQSSRGKIAFEARKASDYYLLIYDAPGQGPIQFEISNESQT